MKKIYSILYSFTLLLSSCNHKNEVPTPQKLIGKPIMENILYDLTLLQALKNFSTEKIIQNNIDPKTYIYQKYKIDSLQFVQNNKYYASDIEGYKAMFINVSERLKKQKAENDTLLNRENKIKSKKISDSIAKTTKPIKPKNN